MSVPTLVKLAVQAQELHCSWRQITYFRTEHELFKDFIYTDPL